MSRSILLDRRIGEFGGEDFEEGELGERYKRNLATALAAAAAALFYFILVVWLRSGV